MVSWRVEGEVEMLEGGREWDWRIGNFECWCWWLNEGITLPAFATPRLWMRARIQLVEN